MHLQGILTRTSLVAGVAYYAAANAFLVGGLGAVGRTAGMDPATVGAILSLGALAGAAIVPAWGLAIEILGRRRVILIGLPLTAAGPITLALAFGNYLPLGIASLLVGRSVQTIFGSALMPAAQAYTADITSERARTSGMSFITAAVSAGAVAGSLILALTATMGLDTGFWLLTGLGALAFLMALIWVPDPPRRPPTVANAAKVPLGRLWPYFSMTFLGFVGYSMLLPLFGLRLADLGGLPAPVAASQAGTVLTIGSLALLAAQVLIAARQGWSHHGLLIAGTAAAFAGAVALVFAGTLLTMALAMTVICLALGAAAPAALGAISLTTGEAAQGKVAGINASARGLGLAIGPFLGAALYTANPIAPFVAVCGVIGVTALLALHAGRVARR